MEDIFRLRYKVYCEEKEFLPRDDYHDGMEYDEFDEHAVHLVVHGDGSMPVGYMRILDGSGPSGYPLFSHGLTVGSDFTVPPEGGAIEISRMIVRSDYRHEFRPVTDGFSAADSLPDPKARNASDLVQFKLLRMTYHHTLRNDLRWVYAAMEPTLHRKFRMMGIPFHPIGPTGSYFGEVRPYAMDIRELESTLSSKFRDTWLFFDSPAVDEHCTVLNPEDWAVPTYSKAA